MTYVNGLLTVLSVESSSVPKRAEEGTTAPGFASSSIDTVMVGIAGGSLISSTEIVTMEVEERGSGFPLSVTRT